VAPRPYLVAMCDVLGFSRLFATYSLEEIHQEYQRLRTLVRSYERTVGYRPRGEHAVEILDGVVFSDTILFWAPAAGAMEVLPMSLSLLMAQTIGSIMPLRIGLAFGDCVIDPQDNIYIGQPIIDAHLTEQRQRWVGGAYHASCSRLPGFMEHLCYWRTAVEYAVPVKEGDPLAHALNWALLAGDDVPSTLRTQEEAAPVEDREKWQLARMFYEQLRAE
jgi:hypothetical protein